MLASPIQRAMLFAERTTPGLYIQQHIGKFGSEFQPELWRRAWDFICAAHQVFHTRLMWTSGGDLQTTVVEPSPCAFEFLDWRGMGQDSGHAGLDRLIAEDRLKSFDYERPQLLRNTVVRMAEDDYHTLTAFPHAVLDGRSWGVVIREVLQVYTALVEGNEPAVPKERPFSDYLELLASDDYSEAREFWASYLRGVEPAHGMVAPGRTSGGGSGFEYQHLGDEEAALVRRRAETSGYSVSAWCLAAWAAVDRQCTARSDLTFGAVRHGGGWTGDDPRPLVGVFINTVPLRVRIDEGDQISTLLDGLRRDWRATRGFERTPLPLVDEACGLRQGSELLECLYLYEETDTPEHGFRQIERSGQLSLAVRSGPGLEAELEYDPARHPASLMAEALAAWRRVLLRIVEDQDARVGDVAVLDAAETEALLRLGHGPADSIPSGTVVSEFLIHARSTPCALAAASPEGEATYAQLLRRACQIATLLQAREIGRGDFVVVLFQASVELLAAELGVMLAGAAFVPVDPSTPAERVGAVLAESGAKAVLTVRTLEHLAPVGLRVGLDELPQPLETDEPIMPGVLPSASDVAYVVYTSGSSGKPKGAVIEHGSLMNLVAHYRLDLGVNASFRSSMISGVAFDASIADVWPYLASGGSVHIPPAAVRADPAGLKEWVIETHISVSFIPTAVAELLLHSDWSGARDLRVLTTGGDKLYRFPPKPLPFRVINTYGPTETTVDATWFDLTPSPEHQQAPPIGRPILNVSAAVLDPNTLRLVPMGVPGVLFLGGAGVARGYLNRPDLTAERFVNAPWDGSRMYNTGDRVYWNINGQLEFLGRNDSQVQLRGFRIELDEIAFHLRAFSGVLQAAVALHTPASGVPVLIAAVVADPVERPEPRELMAFLGQRLPPNMVPARYVFTDRLPLTANGKVDIRALSVTLAVPVDAETPAFATELEAQIAQVFGRVLGTGHLGPRTNLFDSGVDSLGLALILCELNEVTGEKLSLPDLLRFPTAERLARCLSLEAPADPPSVLVPLNDIQSGTPVFCIPGVGGGVHWFHDFAVAREWNCPVLGLEPLLLSDVGRSTEQTASEFLAAIRSVQPNGPWRLCGFSAGGLVAFEIARQITAAGGEVGALNLIEAYGEGSFATGATRVTAALRNLASMSFRRRSEFLSEKVQWLTRRAGGSRSAGEAAADIVADRDRVRRLVESQIRASEEYLSVERESWNGDASIFVCERRPLSAPSAPWFGWRRLISGKLSMHEIPGDHYTIMAPPYLQRLVELVATATPGQ
ncbi:MAG: amino acid adenylation domain-containing protein [Bryobacteraceae bacterium]|nr:amino acid adenylation domain-containing protein [Bryobacteraceae bacterium]